MDNPEDRIEYALRNTQVMRQPSQALATFGVTVVHYYLVTKPAYSDVLPSGSDTVIREGEVSAEKPRIVTPYYMLRLEGFGSEAKSYFEDEAHRTGLHTPGLLYTYRNQGQGTSIVSGEVGAVGQRLAADLDHKGEKLAAVVRGIDEMWDVSLLKFIYDLTRRSLLTNISDLQSKGLLDMDTGVPRSVRMRLEKMFQAATQGRVSLKELKEELDRWGLFDHYEDRFFSTARHRRGM